MFKLTDNLGNGATATVEDTDDVRATLNGWFDITNAEVSEMIDGLITGAQYGSGQRLALQIPLVATIEPLW